MRAATIALTLGLLWIGCSSTYHVPMDPASREFVDARERLHLEKAIVTLIDGTKILLDSTVLQAAHVVGVEAQNRSREEVSLSRIKEIRTTKVGRGAVRGGTKGLIIGGGIGLVVGTLAWAKGEADAMTILGASFVGAIYGGLIVGPIAGMIFLSTDHYSFPADTIVPAINLGPPVRLRMTILPEETPDAVKIIWNGRDIWLKKSDIKIERKDGGIWLTIPSHLLE